jgi:hypothetical protein
MLTDEDLFRRGFRQFPPNDTFDSQNVVCGFSKAVYVDNGKAYFIQLKKFDWAGYPNVPFRYSYDCFAQFKLTEEEVVDVSLHIKDDTTVERIEQFYDQFFQMFHCRNYEYD